MIIIIRIWKTLIDLVNIATIYTPAESSDQTCGKGN